MKRNPYYFLVLVISVSLILGCANQQVNELRDWSGPAKKQAESGDMKWSEYYKGYYSRVEALPQMESKAFYLRSASTMIDTSLAMENGNITKEEFDSIRREMDAAEAEYKEKMGPPRSTFSVVGDILGAIGAARSPQTLQGIQQRRLLEQQKVLPAVGAVHGGGTSRQSYIIEVAHSSGILIINGEKYEAQTYCFGFNEGDRVLFIKGSALGACASAELLNLRNKKVCKVWCW